MNIKESFKSLWSKVKAFIMKYWKQITAAIASIFTVLFFKKKIELKQEVKAEKKEIKEEKKEVEKLNQEAIATEEKIDKTIEKIDSIIETSEAKKPDLKEFLPDL